MTVAARMEPSSPPAVAAADDAPTVTDWLVVLSIIGVIGALVGWIALTSPRSKRK